MAFGLADEPAVRGQPAQGAFGARLTVVIRFAY